MTRDEFSAQTKRRLAQRAGYLCSICNAITVGPSDESTASINLTGVAAHITAAAKGGRRYNKNLSAEQRSDIQNGIWLCTTDGDLIDGDETTFTTDYLYLIKKYHEEKIKFRQSGINVEKGIITKMELSNLGSITHPLSLDFSDRNIILGANGVGKTLICEFIAALTDKTYLERWTSRKRPLNSYCAIHYFKNQPHKFTISINHQNVISYTFNDHPIPLLSPPISIFYFWQSYWEFMQKLPNEEKEDLSLVDTVARYFRLTKEEFINIVTSIMRDKKIFFNDILFDPSGQDLLVKMDGKPDSPLRVFGALSGGEKNRVLLEITLKIASYYAKFNSTILIIEHASFAIDYAGINRLLGIIRDEKVDFQFFFTSFENEKYITTGYTVFTLMHGPEGQVILQK